METPQQLYNKFFKESLVVPQELNQNFILHGDKQRAEVLEEALFIACAHLVKANKQKDLIMTQEQIRKMKLYELKGLVSSELWKIITKDMCHCRKNEYTKSIWTALNMTPFQVAKKYAIYKREGLC